MPSDLPTEAEVAEMRTLADRCNHETADSLRVDDVLRLFDLVEAWAPLVEEAGLGFAWSRTARDEWQRWKGEKP